MQSSPSADDTSALPSCTVGDDYRTAPLDQQPFQKDLTQQNEQIEVEVIALADGRVIAARLEIAFLLQCYFKDGVEWHFFSWHCKEQCSN